jgi:hypothetical protein
MKTKEEIQQLADKAINKEGYTTDDFIIGFEQGYTQCQEDMPVKKYTEEDMYNCWQTAFTDAMNCSNKDYKPFWFKDYINSPNKQD